MCASIVGSDAVAAASEAVELFEEGTARKMDAALASYWLAAGLHQQENSAEARAVTQAIPGQGPGGPAD